MNAQRCPPGRPSGCPPRRLNALWCFALALSGVAGCADGDGPPQGWLQIRRVQPDYELPGLGGGRVFLNQRITVHFNAPIDPMSITRDTIQVVDSDGRPVPGRLERRRQSVDFVPVVATLPDLSDGSFLPDAAYRLVVVGLPAGNAVRSAAGEWLAATKVREFRAVPADVSDFGYPTPFLAGADSVAGNPRDAGPAERESPGARVLDFDLVERASKLPISGTTLRLYLGREPDPRTVRVDAFEAYRSTRSDRELARLRPGSVRLRRLPVTLESGSLSVLELEFDEPPMRAPDDLLFVRFVDDPRSVLRDYRAQPIASAGGFIRVDAYTGTRVPLWTFDPGRDEVRAMPATGIGFEADGVTLVPQVRRDAGDGRLGHLRPMEDVEVHARRGFDPGSGEVVRAQATDFAFRSIHVPEGVTVTFVGDGAHPVVVRSIGSVSIHGRIRFRNLRRGPRLTERPGATVDELIESTPAVIVAGGDVRIGSAVRGSVRGAGIEVVGAPPSRSSLALVAGGEFGIFGGLPRHVVLGIDDPGESIAGSAPLDRILRELVMARGLPDEAPRLEAVGVTDWQPLPRYQLDPIHVVAEHDPALDVAVEIADPDPMNAARPSPRSEHRVRHRLPLTAPLDVPPGAFFRFVLRAPVTSPRLPALRRLAVESR